VFIPVTRRWLIRTLTALVIVLVALGLVGWFRPDLFGALATTQALIAFSAFLIALAGLAWWRSNHAEATPNADELEMMRLLVERDLARDVARWVTTTPGASGLTVPSVAQDPAWRRLFLERLELHQELYALSRRVALDVYSRHIDDAVSREVAALRAATTSGPVGPRPEGSIKLS
jgi:hypothetical protein